MSTAVLSIGSNLGDRLALLQSVVEDLGSRVTAVSPVYETEPWGGVEQRPFLNAVVIASDDVDPIGWLDLGQALENAAGRVRTQHWGPRTLDVDIVTVADPAPVQCATERLTLPHPLAHERAFVLVPWLAADPSATLTVDGVQRPVAELVAALDPAERAGVRRTDLELSCG
ncbi:MAG: 2-amino-4-hydroxy-6-hydroxymethyldihydropteridine diphosphokinase [Mycolicibacterium sp.]|jgi:2-amino-4-hydroxy-6-hydroxymethyldihydropteridine diphosphokinase|nr:2-amino-4-hydroxy-6-hydroxymethyldihydropteridine diphosphokinase [Mycolicibacterium sp.]